MMPPLKMWSYLPVSAIILLSTVPKTAPEVMKSISDCDQFLLEGNPPHIPGILEDGKILDLNRYKPICQTFMNKRRFLTLYDVRNKIPVFSANKYRGLQENGRPPNKWKTEPQLEKLKYGKNMREDKGKVSNHQAANSDYRHDRNFQRGHLLPSSYSFSKTDKMSTFTLTNVVPQAASFNQGSWNRMERCTKCVMDQYCINNNNVTEGFVVTGALPSSQSRLNRKINIPTTLWSAFCCYSSTKNMWLASAHWGANVPDGSKNKYLQSRTLAELHSHLKTAVFPGTRCPLHRTVTTFYPQEKNCNCPSSTLNPSTSCSADTTFLSSTSKSSSHVSTSGSPTPRTTEAGSVTSRTSGPLPVKSATAMSTSGLHSTTSLTLTSSPPKKYTTLSDSDNSQS